MEYKLALAPNLPVDPSAFAAAWNADPACAAAAQAQVEVAGGAQYDISLAMQIIALVGTVGVELATAALYDLIKDVLLRQGVHKRTTIVQHEQADGSRLLIITIDEE